MLGIGEIGRLALGQLEEMGPPAPPITAVSDSGGSSRFAFVDVTEQDREEMMLMIMANFLLKL